MTRVLLAPDKFKGTLTAAQVAEHLSAGILEVRPDVEVVTVPVSDGGDGLIEAAVAAGYQVVGMRAAGPLGEPAPTRYAVHGTRAVVEMAEVCGLARLGGRLAPLEATSAGLGEVIGHALGHGVTALLVGIGGSASTDGGAGMLMALGARLLDASGEPIGPGGGSLDQLVEVDLSGLHPRLSEVGIVVACDVDNPLTGRTGAAAVYGPQKGASPDQVRLLDTALAHLADVITDALPVRAHGVHAPHPDRAHGVHAPLPDRAHGVHAPDPVRAHGVHDLRSVPGAGAAGGVGFAALAVLGAELRPGVEVVLDLTGFRDALTGVDLVVTGEGTLDEQTLHGKAPAGVAASARAADIPVVAVAGVVRLTPEQLTGVGISHAWSLSDLAATPEESWTRPGPLLQEVGRRIAALLPPPGGSAVTL